MKREAFFSIAVHKERLAIVPAVVIVEAFDKDSTRLAVALHDPTVGE
jgi:hypothetical protein